MASERHTSHLKQYFKSHKGGLSPVKPEPPAQFRPSSETQRLTSAGRHDKGSTSLHYINSVSQGSVSSSRPTIPESSPSRKNARSPCKSTQNITTKHTLTRTGKTRKIKAAMDSLPDEIMRLIFSLLNPNDLLLCARVCHRWLHLSNDNVIWQRVYQRYVRNSRRGYQGAPIPDDPPAAYWKTECIKRCAEVRNKSALTMLKKIHPFTGLPTNTEKALQKAGIRWCICFTNSDGQEQTFSHRDVFYFAMATCVRCYSLELPPIDKMRKLRIYSANPVFFDGVKGTPHPNSSIFPNMKPEGRFISYWNCWSEEPVEMDFKWREISQTMPVVAADESINIHILPSNIMVATWKDGGEIAFITVCLHYHYLVSRCLLGKTDRAYTSPTHTARHDDLDTKRGLHGYLCTVELRNQRSSFYSQQFRDIYCPSQDTGSGYASFRLIKEESSFEHSPVGKKISFPWKSDVFKGILQNVCIVDVTLLDEGGAPMWCISAPVKVATPTLAGVVYDYDGDHFFIDYTDTNGKLSIKLVWEEEIGQYIIMSMDIHLALSFINQWFGTKY